MRLVRWVMVILCVGWMAVDSATADLKDGLVAYYQFEGDLTDASGEGHDARPSGGGPARFVDGFLGQAVDTRQAAVDCGTWDPSDENSGAFSASCWVYWLGLQGAAAQWQGVLAKRTGWGAGLSRWQLELGDGVATAYLANQPHGGAGSVTLVPDEWQHIVISFDGSSAAIYRNNTQVGGGNWTLDNDTDATLCIGMSQATNGNRFNGYIDEVAFWSRGLLKDEIALVYNSGAGQSIIGPPVAATKPSPAPGAFDVPQDVTLRWTPGESATSRHVYLGTSWDDVNSATVDAPRGVLAGANLGAASFRPAGVLDFGQTYYWRIDEVDAASPAVYRGAIWSFTVEPFAYPITSVTATAASAQPGMGAQNTVNGSGLNANGEHSTELTQMWMSAGVKPNWIQYEFDGLYKLHELWIWNSNQLIEAFVGFGARDVTIEYSVDGETWTTLDGVPEFARAAGSPTYTANTTVGFGGALAKFVRLTINQTWGGVAPQASLSEVRFFYIPVQARAPQPAVAATDVLVDAELSWRPGREAESHDVYLGVAEDTLTLAATVGERRYTPASLDFGTTYFWKVDEVGGDGPYAGDLWSFTTQEYATIEDFESYNDDDRRIYDTWIDGLTDAAKGGSQVGYDVAPFVEKVIVHAGRQSMPLRYDNSASPFLSEAERVFETAQDWTTHGADSLRLYFRGAMPAFAETPSGSILMNALGTDIWDAADQFRFAHKALNGNGSMIARVNSIFSSNAWAKGGVMIRQSTDPGSAHAFMALTPGGSSGGNGASFQRRPVANQASASSDSTTIVAAPYWVRIERSGNSFSGSISPDGTTWTQVGTAQTISMTGPVLIGLALTSHNVTVATGAEFSDIAVTGNVTGGWQVAEIGAAQPAGNSIEGVYITVKDSAGKSRTVMHPDAMATVRSDWQSWEIPLSGFTSAGVKMSAVKSLTIGVGNKATPAKGGTGTVYIDGIAYGRALP